MGKIILFVQSRGLLLLDSMQIKYEIQSLFGEEQKHFNILFFNKILLRNQFVQFGLGVASWIQQKPAHYLYKPKHKSLGIFSKNIVHRNVT